MILSVYWKGACNISAFSFFYVLLPCSVTLSPDERENERKREMEREREWEWERKIRYSDGLGDRDVLYAIYTCIAERRRGQGHLYNCTSSHFVLVPSIARGYQRSHAIRTLASLTSSRSFNTVFRHMLTCISGVMLKTHICRKIKA